MGFLVSLSVVVLAFSQCINGLQYSVTAPNTFRIGVQETVGVAITNSPTPVQVEIFIHDRTPQKKVIDSQKLTLQNDKPQITTLLLRAQDVPADQKDQPHIFVDLAVKESTNKFYKEMTIPVTKYSGYVFVQTDKPIYLPNQRVHIRLFYLDENLLPLTGDLTLEVKNPNGSRVLYKENLPATPSGITEASFKFPSSPVFGNWTVTAFYGYKKAARTTVRFEVKDYVLPTFSVKIKSQKVVLKTDNLVKVDMIAEYVYGKPVEGFVNYKFAIRKPSGSIHSIGGHSNLKLRDGKSTITIRKSDIVKKLQWFPAIDKSVLIVEAEVIEQATGKRESEYDDSTIFTTSPYVIDLSRSLNEFKPGVPYQVQVDVRLVNNQPVNDRIPVTVNARAKKGGNFQALGKKPDLRTDVQGRVMFQFDTDENFEELVIEVQTKDEAVGDNQAKTTLSVIRYNTPVSKTYVWIAAPHEGTLFQVGKTFQTQVTVYPQERQMKLMYMVVSRGKILMMNETETRGEAVVRTIQFPVTVDMSPSFRLIVYFIKNGKIIADSLNIDVERTCKYNNGKFSVTADSSSGFFSPNQEVTFKITGEPDSVVGIGAVDEAVYLLNDRDVLTRDKMFKELSKHDLGTGPGGGINPAVVFKNAGILMLSNNEIGEHGRKEGITQPKERRKRSLLEKVEEYSGQAAICCKFGQFEGPVDMDCADRAAMIYEKIGEKFNCSTAFLDCCENKLKYMAANPGRANQEVEDEKPINELIEMVEADTLKHIRHIFPETWFFNTLQIGDGNECKGEQGQCITKFNAPHSITTWVIQGIAVSKTTGMCVAEPLKITVFKKTFVQLSLPPVAIRGEQIEVLATVFNYEPEDLDVSVYMFGVEGVCMGAGPGERTEIRKLKVPANGASSATFSVMPLEVSEYQLRVAALSYTSSDAVQKVLRVVPEGARVEKSISFTLDPGGIYSKRPRRQADHEGTIKDVYDEVLRKQLITVDLDLPNNHIPGTEKCFISVVGDPVGQAVNTTLSGLGGFLKMPTGCGEQTMIALGPLVYTMSYLKKTKQMTANIEDTGYKYLWGGYSLQQKYRKADGSYAVWATYASSTWLTAFVAKVFCQASAFIPIPPENINTALEWLVKRQHANGIFAEAYKVHHREMTGGIQGDVTLTAYVLISLLECNKYDSVTKKTAVNRAILFLEQNIPHLQRPYTIAIVSYALALTNSTKRQEANQKLKNIAKFHQESYTRYWNWDATEFGAGPKPWVYQHKPAAVAVETTSYALLAQLAYDDLDYAHPIVNWLNRQRSASGSFVSTQDTVMALQALTEYNIKANVPALDIMCNISSSASARVKRTILLKKDRPQEIQEIEVPPKGRLYFDVTGKGMGTLSLSMRFNVEKNPEDSCHYDLTITSEEADEIIKPVNLKPEFAGNDILPAAVVRSVFDERVQKEKFGYDVEGKDENNPAVDRAGKEIYNVGSQHVIKINICVKYKEKQNAGMSILDVGLFTGYKPIKEDLITLTMKKELKVGQFEITDRSVILYLDEVPINKPICLNFRASKEIHVGKVQPTAVKIYNYYDPDKSCTQFYGPDKGSVMLKKICEGKQCVCVEGICPSCFPFQDIRNIANDIDRRMELLNAVCDRKTDYFWNGTIKNIREDGSFKYFEFEVTDVLKEGVQQEREIQDETVTFVGKAACNCPKLTIGEVYMIMGEDGFEYKTDTGEKKFKYLFSKYTRIYHSRSLRMIQDQRGQKLQKTFNTIYMRFKRGERCIH
uniref:Complement component 3-1 n=1 Tax=Scolopendra japonica TaxID=2609777 RepID=A0A0E4B905_9MYRI|nr:complement component 3-1 [Scolopendra japonica]